MSAFENQRAGGMGGGDGEKRVRCMYCGANNFPSSPACWQCNRPLQALRTPDGPAASGPPPSRPMPGQTYATAGRPSQGGQMESALAPKAAATLGLMFPYVGLPVGIVFLMLDDPRKTQLGWITIGWSVAGTIASTLLMIPLLAPVMAFLKGFIPHGGHGGGLPGIPPMPGGEDDPGLLLLTQFAHIFLENLQALGH